MDRATVFALIGQERDRQMKMFSNPGPWGTGDCSSHNVPDIVKVAVLGEEYGEVARAVLDHNYANLMLELVQVAAVSAAWLEGMEE